jgi:hypothetical protein
MAVESVPTKHVEPAAPKAPVKLRKFEAPAELSEKFGVQTQQEDHITGLLKTEHVRQLLDAFGLQDRTELSFPFQHLKKQHGEIWSMRIEPAAVHSVDGAPVLAHQWTYMQQYPERTGAAS